MNLLVLLVAALPACLAQFSIQGPSDGNRVAQGLRIEEGKGIQYTDQNESNDSGFSITGASDGAIQVQGATDGHSNFQIQGATQGAAERYVGHGASPYSIQGATDGQSIIQGSYDGNQASTKSLQYNDPSGLRVNWRSYDRQSRPAPQQEAQYSEAAIASVPRAPHRQRAPAPRQPPQPQPHPEPIAYQQTRALDNAPVQIKQLLQLQQQLPYVNIVPEPYRYENLIATQGAQQQHQQQQQLPQYQPEYQEVQEPRRPAYRGKPRGPPRQRRQAQQHRTDLPPHIQEVLKYQAQTPYVNLIPEQFRFNPEPSAQAQMDQFRKHYSDLLRQQPTSPVVHTAIPATAPPPVRNSPSGQEQHRQKRQAQHRQQSQLVRQHQPAGPVPQYSSNLPPHLQNLLHFQSQIPYNIIANQVEYRVDKPYVPQPAQPPSPPQVQYQGAQSPYQAQQSPYQGQQAQYQGQQGQGGDSYQGQSSGYSQVYASQPQYPQYTQAQLGAQYAAQQADKGVRPVTENQY